VTKEKQMAQQGSKGSKGPDKVVAHRQGHVAGASEGQGGSPSHPKKPGGTKGTKGGAR
jgi:hypothetical protein